MTPEYDELPIDFQTSPSEEFGYDEMEADFDPSEEESLTSLISRQPLRTASRVFESGVGGTGDLLDFIKSAVVYGHEKVTGKKSPFFEQAVKRDIPGLTPPTSPELRDLTRETFGKATEPQNEWERKADEVASTFGSLLNPGSGYLKPLAGALSSNLAKEGLKALGGGEGQQEGVKIATMFLTDILLRGNARKFVNNLYDEADALRPKGRVYVQSNKFKDLENSLQGIIETGEKSAVLKPLGQILDRLHSNPHLTVKEMTDLKRDLNKLRGEPGTLKGAKKLLNNMAKLVDEEIETWGKQNAPEWLDKWRSANQGYAGLAASDKVKNFVEKNYANPHLVGGLMSLFGGGLASGGLAATATAAGGAVAAAQTANILHRIMTNPTLRGYYADVVKYALAEDAKAMSASLNKLDKSLYKVMKEDEERKKNPKKFRALVV